MNDPLAYPVTYKTLKLLMKQIVLFGMVVPTLKSLLGRHRHMPMIHREPGIPSDFQAILGYAKGP